MRLALKTNLRNLKKEERIKHKNEKRDKIVKPAFGLTNTEFREKFTILPYQKVFQIQRVEKEEEEVKDS